MTSRSIFGKPDLNLVEPGRIGWGETRLADIGVKKSRTILGLVRGDLVPDDVN